MKLLKVTFALLILLSSSIVFAFSPTSISHTDTKETIGIHEVSETVANLYESTLALSVSLQKKTPSVVAVLHSFRFNSVYESASVNKYLKRSKYIEPGLDVPDIIFPFHIFL